MPMNQYDGMGNSSLKACPHNMLYVDDRQHMQARNSAI